MPNLRNYMQEIVLTIISLVLLLFIQTNVNKDLADVYITMLVISLSLLFINILIFDRNVRVTIQKEPGKWLEAIFGGLIGYGLVVFASFVIFNIWDKTGGSIFSIIKSLSATTPAFANSVIINFLALALLIPIAETTLFSRIFEIVADFLHIPISREKITNVKMILLVIFLSFLFAIFHATAKGINSTSSLLLVGIMMFVTLGMIVFYNGETRQAIFMHCIANSAAAIILLMSGGGIHF